MNLKKTVRIGVAAAAMAGSALAFGASPAAAAHCTDNGGPGHSDFAAHARANNGPGAHNEGQHRGWSTCEENSKNFGG